MYIASHSPLCGCGVGQGLRGIPNNRIVGAEEWVGEMESVDSEGNVLLLLGKMVLSVR